MKIRGRLEAGGCLDITAWGNGVCAGDFDDDGRLDLYVTIAEHELLVPQSRRRLVRGSHRVSRWGGRRLEHRLHVSSMRMPTATWICMSHATSRRPGTRSCAPSGRLSGATGPGGVRAGPAGLPLEPDLFFENLGNGRFGEAAEGAAGSPTRLAPTASAWSRPTTTTMGSSISRGRRLEPQLSVSQPRDGRFEGVGSSPESRSTAMPGPRLGWAQTRALRWRLPHGPRPHGVAHDRDALYRNVDGRPFEERGSRRRRLPGRRSCAWARPRPSSMRTSMASWISSSRSATSSRISKPSLSSKKHADSEETTSLSSISGTRFRDVSERAGGGLQVARVGRGLAVGESDDDGDPNIVVERHGRRAYAARRPPSRDAAGWRSASFLPQRNRFAISAKVTVDAGGMDGTEIRSGGSYLSQSDLRAYFGLGDHAGPVDVEVRMPGGRALAMARARRRSTARARAPESASVPKAGDAR